MWLSSRVFQFMWGHGDKNFLRSILHNVTECQAPLTSDFQKILVPSTIMEQTKCSYITVQFEGTVFCLFVCY